MTQERLFTLDEAIALLPVVRQLLLELRECKAVWDDLSARLEGLYEQVGGNGHLRQSIEAAQKALSDAGEAMQTLMGELATTGAELKGIEEGLVDFPSERDGRVVYLCWRLGEETIAYWHELDTGFAGRLPL